MKLKPKYANTEKLEFKLSKRSVEILAQYSKYSNHEEGDILEGLIDELLDVEEFVMWLKRIRFHKRAHAIIFGENSINELGREVKLDESIKKDFNP